MSIDPLLLNVKPISEITTVNNPTEGHLLFYDGSDELKKTNVSDFYNAMQSAYLGIATTTTTPPATGAYWYRVTTAGTYTNFLSGGSPVVVTEGDFYDGTKYYDVTIEVKDNVATKRVNQVNNAEVFQTINSYSVDPEQIVPSEALYTDDTLAGDIIKRVDKNTGENVNYRETTTWVDGSAMDDSKVDGVIFIKKNNKYYQIVGKELNAKLLGAKEGGFDNSPVLQRYWDVWSPYYSRLFFPKGNYSFKTPVVFSINRDSVIIDGCKSNFNVSVKNGVFIESNSNASNEFLILKDMNINGNLSDYSTAIKINKTNIWTFQNVVIFRFFYGLELTDTYYGGFVGNSAIRHCWTCINFKAGQDKEINVIDLSNLKLDGAKPSSLVGLFTKNEGESEEDFIRRTGTAGIRSNCTFNGLKFNKVVVEGFDYGFMFGRNSELNGNPLDGIINIIDCYFEANRQYDIAIFEQKSNNEHVFRAIFNIENNRFYNGRVIISEGAYNFVNNQKIKLSRSSTPYPSHINISGSDVEFLNGFDDSSNFNIKYDSLRTTLSKADVPLQKTIKKYNYKNFVSTQINSVTEESLMLTNNASLAFNNSTVIKSGGDLMHSMLWDNGKFYKKFGENSYTLKEISNFLKSGQTFSNVLVNDSRHLLFNNRISKDGDKAIDSSGKVVIANREYVLNNPLIPEGDYIYLYDIEYLCYSYGGKLRAFMDMRTRTCPSNYNNHPAPMYFSPSIILENDNEVGYVGQFKTKRTDSSWRVYDGNNWILWDGNNIPEYKWYGTIEERAKKANYYKQIYVDSSTGNLSIYTPNGWKDLTFTKISSQANSTATDITALQADFNALLSKLKSAGLMD